VQPTQTLTNSVSLTGRGPLSPGGRKVWNIRSLAAFGRIDGLDKSCDEGPAIVARCRSAYTDEHLCWRRLRAHGSGLRGTQPSKSLFLEPEP